MHSAPRFFRRVVDRTGEPDANRQELSRRPRDFLAAALLFVATAAFVLWQNSRVAVLWDLGYLLDTSWRMALGQMPYRDFPLAHAPLTFLLQAALIRLGGRHFFLVMAYAAAAGGLGTVLAWRIVLRILCCGASLGSASWPVALLLTMPLSVLGIYCVYPHPIYDCDCTLAILAAVYLLGRIAARDSISAESMGNQQAFPALKSCHPERSAALRRGVEGSAVAFLFRTGERVFAPLAAGAASVLPLFFKQNMGLPFLAAVAGGTLVLLAMEALRTRSLRSSLRSQPGMILAGMGVALIVALCVIGVTAGVGNYFHWTVQFAARRRLPGLASMIAVYQQPSFAWTLPALAAGLILCGTRWMTLWWARVTAFCLIAAPFAGRLIFLLIDDDADERADNLLALWPLLLLAALVMALFELRRGITLGRLIPFFVLAAIHGTFLSQQLWGSTYALWPMLMVLVACLLSALPVAARLVAMAAGATIAMTFLVCGALYAVSFERLRYVQIPDAALQRSSLPALRGMATPGPFLPNLEELSDFVAREIPPTDVVLPLPGEDPFFYASGRTPQFPVTLFDPATDPYSAAELMGEARRRNVRWVIVKRMLQINENPEPEAEETMRLLEQDFALYRRLRGYDIFRRR